MLKALQEVRDHVVVNPNMLDWDFVDEMVEALKDVAELTTRMQKEVYLMGDFFLISSIAATPWLIIARTILVWLICCTISTNAQGLCCQQLPTQRPSCAIHDSTLIIVLRLMTDSEKTLL